MVDRWFPSSKTCSQCGAVKAKLARSERTYVAAIRGLVLDRDVNAARNLAKLGEAVASAQDRHAFAGSGRTGSAQALRFEKVLGCPACSGWHPLWRACVSDPGAGS